MHTAYRERSVTRVPHLPTTGPARRVSSAATGTTRLVRATTHTHLITPDEKRVKRWARHDTKGNDRERSVKSAAQNGFVATRARNGTELSEVQGDLWMKNSV